MTTSDTSQAAPAASTDLTAKARIRNAALELHAAKGTANTTIREVAQLAGVTHGLVVHHFTNKDGLRRAVREYVLGLVRDALEDVPKEGTPTEIRHARDTSVHRMFVERPTILDYFRRALQDPAEIDSELVSMLADLTLGEIRDLRAHGLASTERPDYAQAMAVMLREFGPALLAPVAEQFWTALTDGTAGPTPELKVTTKWSSS